MLIIVWVGNTCNEVILQFAIFYIEVGIVRFYITYVTLTHCTYNLMCTQLGLTMTVSMHYCKLIGSSMEWYLSYLFGYGYCAHFFNLYLMIKSLKIWYIWRLHVIGVVNVALTKSHISLLKIDNHVRRDSNINIWYFIV